MKGILLLACLVAVVAADPCGKTKRGISSFGPADPCGRTKRGISSFWPRRYAYRRSAADIAALFPEMDSAVANAIADGLIATGIDKPSLEKPISAADPETIRTGVTAVYEAMLTRIPEGCKDALAVHITTGFARHILREFLVKDFYHIVEECTEISRVHDAISPGFRGPDYMRGGFTSGTRPRFIPGGPSPGSVATPGSAPTMEQWRTVVTTPEEAISTKMASIIPARENVRLEGLFALIKAEIDLAALNDGTVAELLAGLAATTARYLAAFMATGATCPIPGHFAQLSGGVAELANFLTVDAIAMLDGIDLPGPAKPLVIQKLTSTMTSVAAKLTDLIRTYNTDNFVPFIMATLQEASNEAGMMANLLRVVDGLVDAPVVDYVNTKVAEGETDEVVKVLLRTVAMTLSDIRPEEIEMIMTKILGLVTDDPSLVAAPQERTATAWK